VKSLLKLQFLWQVQLNEMPNGVVDSRGKNVQETKSWWRQVVKFIQLNKEDLATQVTKGVKLDDEK
jgi:transcription termination factor NusB